MVAHRKTRRLIACVVVSALNAGIALALSGSALARPADAQPHPTPASLVRQIVLRAEHGSGTVSLLLIGLGACAALLGAGYLGARIALHMRLAAVRPGRPSRTSG